MSLAIEITYCRPLDIHDIAAARALWWRGLSTLQIANRLSRAAREPDRVIDEAEIYNRIDQIKRPA